MKAVVSIVHGSQIPQKNKDLEVLLQEMEETLGDVAQFYEIAYLERQENSIEKVVQRLVDKGVTAFVILPILLFPALHAKVDIPRRVGSITCNYPEIEVNYLKTFGEEEEIFSILVDRVREAKKMSPDCQIVLLAHGTRHFSEPEERLAEIARRLAETTQTVIRPADYLGKRTYRKVLKENKEKNQEQIVLPFFIYDGVLVKKIYQAVQKMSPEKEIVFTETLALDKRIKKAWLKIIVEEKQL